MLSFEKLRVAARTLRKQPGFSIVVILSLALAISLNTTMYSVLDAMVHPPIDLRNPEELFSIKFFGDYRGKVPMDKRDSLLRSSTHVITAVASYDAVHGYGRQLVTAGDRAMEARVGPVSLEYFGLMGPKVLEGRTFVPSDRDATPRPIVVNERLVSQLFAPGTDPMGGTIKVRDDSYKVVGVLSRYTTFGDDDADAWILADPPARGMFSRVVRVKPGVTRKELEQDLAIVAARIATAAGQNPDDVAFRVAGTTLEQWRINNIHRALIYAVIAVLLVACANVANMQLARGIGRRRELALRTALGATRRRLVSHLLTESALLSAIGLIVGLVLTFWGIGALKASVPPAIGEFVVNAHLNWRVLVFAIVATIFCILLIGLLPSIRVSRVDPNEMLKSGAGTGALRRNRRQYGYLVVVEIALALALLSGSTLMVRSAMYASTMSRGYDPTHLATGYSGFAVPRGQQRALPDLLNEVAEHAAVSGATSVAVETGGGFENQGITLADASGTRELPVPGYGYRVVTPSYFRTFNLPIIAGRDFLPGERDQPAVIIDEYTAKKLWPNANPVGALIKLGDAKSTRPFVRVVGVVGQRDRDGSIKPMNMADASGATIGYITYLPGMADSIGPTKYADARATITVRTAGDASQLAAAMRRGGIRYAQTMDEALGITKLRMSEAFMAKLFTLFAVLGVGLAAFGVYGVIAHSVAERRRELGVRVALGATSRDILRAVLRESVVIGLAGAAVGLLATKYGVMLLVGVAAFADIYDAPLFAVVAAFMLLIAAASAYVPALRATRIDPTESLRSE